MLLSGAPRAVIASARAARTLALMAAGLLARPWRRNSRTEPPLWLRRHTGPVADIPSSADAADSLLAELALVGPASRVVDAGCGFGVMATRISSRLGPAGRYLGLDVHAPSIRWARRHLAAADARLRFERVRPGEPWPLGAGGDADLVLAKSLFTHLTEEPARLALSETARALRPGGRALVTAFLFEADQPPESLFPWPGPDAPVRWRLKNRPEAAVAWDRARFTQLVGAAGLEVIDFRPGFWPRGERLDAQDILVLGKSQPPAAVPQ